MFIFRNYFRMHSKNSKNNKNNDKMYRKEELSQHGEQLLLLPLLHTKQHESTMIKLALHKYRHSITATLNLLWIKLLRLYHRGMRSLTGILHSFGIKYNLIKFHSILQQPCINLSSSNYRKYIFLLSSLSLDFHSQ